MLSFRFVRIKSQYVTVVEVVCNNRWRLSEAQRAEARGPNDRERGVGFFGRGCELPLPIS